mmetsp:Transcript_35569/g.98461  ORF Transcript_35569/g.98461 Transcript_35569/m.98461 type:complete len:442 (-) Transcript_35569:199-1524(-)|eukprot:CAMPEP_0179053956 /NCGR_PEP_ID=MMETSP0796-20121207/22540_1 /TAXON_ID=73915 /ORGANISM="Pyrodinium bahamense, Strain pbaha01" /LENGTH=441 /DNA_ID=CAMNT_0020750569 /DNA_START=11 /DNA_END=1336 /DNA_ORIENTATION=-
MRAVAHALVGSCCARGSRHDKAATGERSERALFARESLHEIPGSVLHSSKVIYDSHANSNAVPHSAAKRPLKDGARSEREGIRRDRNEQVCKGAPPAMSSSQFISSLATVTIALMIFFYEGAAYNMIFLGRVLPARDKDACVIPFMILFNLFWGLALWSYLQAHWADPGSVPRRWQDFALSAGDTLPVAPARLEWQPGKATWCKKCAFPRPERSHHCHVCGICVLRMDHHCPYIFNCVGFNNHKFFLLLVVYSSIATIVCLGTTLPDLVYCTGALFNMPVEKKLQKSEIMGFLIAGLLDIFLSIVLVPMVPAHLALAVRNQTSIEGNYTNMPNPFDQGGARANLTQILGAYGLDWFVPVRPLRPTCDGISFVRYDEYEGDAEMSDELADSEDPEQKAERIWRLRYRVRRHGSPSNADEQAGGATREPLDAIAHWWRTLGQG